MKKTATGTSKLAINKGNFSNYKLPYFDIDHQKKFCGKLISIENKKDQLQENSTFQQSHLTLLRQQILQDAISGKLTADWRSESPDTEPASKLLEQIKVEKEKALPPISEDEVPFELPEGWEWCRLGDVGLVKRGKSPKYDKNSNIFALNQKCVRWDYVDTSFAKEVKQDWLNSIDSDFLTKEGDLLVNSTGEGTIGRSAIVDHESAGMIFDSHVLCFKKLGDFLTRFAMILINSQFGQRQIDNSKGAKSTKQTELGVGNLRNLLFPLPPRAEQREIVTKAERLMGYVSQLEEKIAQNTNSAETLMQVFLGEVF